MSCRHSRWLLSQRGGIGAVWWTQPLVLPMNLLLGLLLAVTLALPASAQTRSFSAACRQQCNAVAGELAANPTPVQACLVRCQAGSDYTRGINAAPARAQASGRPVQAATPAGSWAVIYAALPPGSTVGTSVQADRNQAHAEAERACFGRNQAPCRLLGEAGPGECVAAAQAGRTVGLVRTSDPRTFQVSVVEYGKAATKAEAERVAVANCSGRGQCELVISVCAARP